jgi:hypothetical protein
VSESSASQCVRLGYRYAGVGRDAKRLLVQTIKIEKHRHDPFYRRHQRLRRKLESQNDYVRSQRSIGEREQLQASQVICDEQGILLQAASNRNSQPPRRRRLIGGWHWARIRHTQIARILASSLSREALSIRPASPKGRSQDGRGRFPICSG